MIQLDNDTLKKLQSVELEILVEFDRVCRKNNIRYSLTGGTLLGAVRHGGFIPWDDDADVSMLREDYEKFRDAVKRDLSEEFYFQDVRDTEGYRWGYGKLRKKNTLFLRENQEHMPFEQGVFMDIFPRDGVPDGKIKRKLHKFVCFCLRKTMWSAVGRKVAKKKSLRVWYNILYYLTKNSIPKMYQKLVNISNKRNTKLVRALTFPVPHNEDGYKREWYNESTELVFEGKKFMVESCYKEWLEQEFGDYMQLPPVEKRKTHPVVDIRL